MMLVLDPYQEYGADWLAHNERNVLYLADQMRVGKTPQAAVAAVRAGAERVVVICPAIVRSNWLNEFRAFAPESGFAENAVVVYSADDIERVGATTRLVILSYDLNLKRAVWSKLLSWAIVYSLDVLILDEAHYLKEVDAKRTRVILGRTFTGAGALAGCAGRVWWLSGTPMPNHAAELFPFMREAGLWKKSRTDFVNKFCFGMYNGHEFKITGSTNLPLLKKLLAPVTLRRLRTDVGGAEVHTGTVTIEPREIDPLNPVVKMLQREEPKYASIIAPAIRAGTLDKLDIKSTATTRRLIGIAKVAGITDLVKEALAEDPSCKVVVFGIHRLTLRYLRATLGEYQPVLMFGGQTAKSRDRLLTAFQTNHKRRVFLGNLGAAGLGIDLSVADLVFIAEASWTPIDNAQALSRILNVRQKRVKEAVFVGLANSIDDVVARTYERKARDIETLYSAV